MKEEQVLKKLRADRQKVRDKAVGQQKTAEQLKSGRDENRAKMPSVDLEALRQDRAKQREAPTKQPVSKEQQIASEQLALQEETDANRRLQQVKDDLEGQVKIELQELCKYHKIAWKGKEKKTLVADLMDKIKTL